MKLCDLYARLCLLYEKKIENCGPQLKHLLMHLCGYTDLEFALNQQSILTPKTITRAHKLARKLATGYPLNYIIKSKAFWKSDFYVNKSVLIPRSDSEFLVEAVSSWVRAAANSTGGRFHNFSSARSKFQGNTPPESPHLFEEEQLQPWRHPRLSEPNKAHFKDPQQEESPQATAGSPIDTPTRPHKGPQLGYEIRPLYLLDIGTGSGCLLLSLLHELPQAVGVGVDISSLALKVSKRNARRLSLQERSVFIKSDLFSTIRRPTLRQEVARKAQQVLRNVSYNRASKSTAEHLRDDICSVKSNLAKHHLPESNLVECQGSNDPPILRDFGTAAPPLRTSNWGKAKAWCSLSFNWGGRWLTSLVHWMLCPNGIRVLRSQPGAKADTLGVESELRFDIILSNPPYIARGDTSLDAKVAKFEPAKALYAPNKGLYFYQQIMKEAPQYLRPGGLLAFELGYNQAEEVKQLARNLKYELVGTYKDYGGIERVILLTSSDVES